MPTITEALRGLSDDVTRLSSTSAGDAPFSVLTAIESLDQLRTAPRGGLIICPRHVTDAMAGFEFDTALRYAADAGVSGLLFVGAADLPLTARRVADRAQLVVLGYSGPETVVQLIHRLDTVMGFGEASAVSRAADGLAAVAARASTLTPEEIVDLASRAIGTSIAVEWLSTRPAADGERIDIGTHTYGWVRASHSDDTALRLMLPAVAAFVRSALERELEPVEERAALVAELIQITRQGQAPAAARARERGVELDARHVFICVTSDRDDAMTALDVSESRHLVRASYLALHRAEMSRWHVVRMGGDVGLLWSSATLDAPEQAEIRQAAQSVLDALSTVTDDRRFYAGVGSQGDGLEGLISSAMSARAAARHGREQSLAGQITTVEATPLDVMLVDLLASPLSMRALHGLLSPLDSLSPKARETSIRTLSMYLDHQGSNQRAAEKLHLHPNAVAYRVKKVLALLGTDINDPDLRFALHLACRISLIHTRTSSSPS